MRYIRLFFHSFPNSTHQVEKLTAEWDNVNEWWFNYKWEPSTPDEFELVRDKFRLSDQKGNNLTYSANEMLTDL